MSLSNGDNALELNDMKNHMSKNEKKDKMSDVSR